MREIVRHMREVAAPPRDPSPEQIADEVIVRMEEAMRDLAEARADLTGTALVKALGVYLKALMGHYRLLEKPGGCRASQCSGAPSATSSGRLR